MKLFSTFIFLLISLQIQAQTNCVIATADIIDISCIGATDGNINLTVINGTPPYSFLWSTGAVTEDIAGLGAGNYSVVVTDSLGCTTHFPDQGAIGFPSVIQDAISDNVEGTTTIPNQITQFPAGDTLSSLDFFEIHLIVEHSWLRDLEISIECPNGSSAILHDHPSNDGGEHYLGIPIEDEIPPTPGIPWDYWWVNNGKNGTWLEFCNAPEAPVTLPVQAYAAYDNLETLIGCPLNGEWSMTFKDFWPVDEGFVFDWYLKTPEESSGPFETLVVFDSDVDCVEALVMGDITLENISCFNIHDGSACAEATGGVPPYTFAWSNEVGNVITVGECISDLAAGTYFVIVTDAENTTTDPITIEITQPDQIFINISLETDTSGQFCIPYAVAVGGVAPYDITFTPQVVTDEVIVTVIDANGCEEQASAVCLIDKTYEIEDLAYFNLSPNPTTGILNVAVGFGETKSFEITVKNITGQEVFSQRQNQQQFEEKLDLTQQPAGLYFVEIITNEGRIVQKFVIE